MSSAQVVVNALKDVVNRKDLDRYDENLCADIHQRLDSKLRESNMTVGERTVFVRCFTIFDAKLFN
jgi:hypothetical protein